MGGLARSPDPSVGPLPTQHPWLPHPPAHPGDHTLGLGEVSPAALGQLYYRRWAMELTLRNIKTTLQMEQLSCQNPENLEREIRLHFLVHNLVRRLMLEAARRYRVPLERVSFAGSLATARRYGEAQWQ